MRRAFSFVGPLTLSACGLFTSFAGFSDNVDNVSPSDPDTGSTTATEAGGKEAGVDSGQPLPKETPCPLPEGAIGCELGRIDAIVATDAAVLWMAPRGAVHHTLATADQSPVDSAPSKALSGTAVLRNGRFTWGYRTESPSILLSCDVDSCHPEAKEGTFFTDLRKLSASAAGIYAWTGDGVGSKLVSVEATVAFSAPLVFADGKGISHFMVSGTTAYWRFEGGLKQGCALSDCALVPSPAMSTGQAPFAPLSNGGFVSANRDSNMPFVKVCPATPGEGCAKAGALPFSATAFDPLSEILTFPSALAVTANDEVYVGGAATATNVQVVRSTSTAAAGLVSTPVDTRIGTAVTALAVNTKSVFFAVTTADNNGTELSVVYAHDL